MTTSAPRPPTPPDAGPGFDVGPPLRAPPARRGLSHSEKAVLGLALFAVLGAVALVVDVLAARDGQTPASGFDQFAKDGAQGHEASGEAPLTGPAADEAALDMGLPSDPSAAGALADEAGSSTTGTGTLSELLDG